SLPDGHVDKRREDKSDPFGLCGPRQREPQMMKRRHPRRGGPLQAGPRTAVRSQRADVLRLRTLGALGDLELDLLVLVQGLVALGLTRRVVNEDVVAAAVLSDEAEALFCVEPLNGALSHVLSYSS